jgi:hypothetical protein
MNGHAYPDRPVTKGQSATVVGLLALVVLAVVATLAVIAPTASAGKDRTRKHTFTLPDIQIGDPYLSQACGIDVRAIVGGTFDEKLVLGTDRNPAVRETSKFDGHITWFAMDAPEKAYSDRIENVSRIDFPEGIEGYGLSAHVTVTGTHPGTFPAEGGAPGHGKYEYEAGFLPGGLPDDFPFVFQIGDGTWDGNSFDRATAKICAALT